MHACSSQNVAAANLKFLQKTSKNRQSELGGLQAEAVERQKTKTGYL